MTTTHRLAACTGALTLVLLAAGDAAAIRPTSGGTFAFDASDVVESWDEPEGLVRVHYSVEGPSVTHLEDDDNDGVPDFAQDVALTTAEVLDLYTLELNLRAPVSEEEMGLGELGGSYALDVYLVDFDGMGDGSFGVDDCTSVPNHCAGYLMVENDFFGYGYWDLGEAVDILASHELFHGVQYAYDGGQDVWITEGTASWAELQFLGDTDDFMWFADAYLADTGRSLDVPPTGPVPSWAYGTCIWWDFMTTRHSPLQMAVLWESLETDGDAVDTLAEMEAVIEGQGDTLADAWFTFAQWNLATGDRAGAMDTYWYADRLDGIVSTAQGEAIDDDNRFYPLAASYYLLEHAGGPIWFGIEESAPDLRFALHPVADGDSDGPVEPAVDSWTGEQTAAWALADGAEFAAGGYWLVGSQPIRAEDSVKVRICLGDEAAASACAPVAADDDDDDSAAGDDDDGCGCTTDGRSPLPSLLMLFGFAVALASRARRR